MKPITIPEMLIAAAILSLMYLFIIWADRKKKKDEKKWPSADVKRLDDFERKISE